VADVEPAERAERREQLVGQLGQLVEGQVEHLQVRLEWILRIVFSAAVDGSDLIRLKNQFKSVA
jgi:hypothetical protein